MKRLSPRDGPARLRARRWDAIVLGGALPGLVAATRLALGSQRVLLVEEEAAARVSPSLRDPFVIPHAVDAPIDRCLQALGLPLIDRRRLSSAEVGLQVLLPGVRADVGNPRLTADELVAWGVEKPDVAAAWLEQLVATSSAERAELQGTPFVRSGRALGLGRGREPSGLRPPPPAPGSSLNAWCNAISSGLAFSDQPVAPRALGAVLEGVGCFATAAESLTGLLRQRFQALHGEIRLVSSRLSLVTVDGAAAIRPGHGGELWVARAMIVNAPVSALRHFLLESGGGDPDFLPARRVRARRVEVAFDTERDQIPEGMARRLIDASRGPESAPVRIGWNPSRSGARAEIFANTIIHSGDATAILAAKEVLVDHVRALLPFAGERLHQRDAPETPAWDNASILEESAPGEAWPNEIAIRLVARPPVYRLPRESVAALGTEGECLLGWRAGDTILGDLG